MKKLYSLFILLLLLASCSPQASSSPQPLDNSPLSLATSTPIATFEPIVFAPAPSGARIGDSVPAVLREQVQNLNLSNFILDASPFVESNPLLSEKKIQWVYALVAPFPTVTDGVTLDQLRLAWTEGKLINGMPLLMEESTRDALTVLWDAPASPPARIVSTGELLDEAWSESAWAIVPFEELQPKWKVLTIDGESPIRKNFDLASYPLIVDFTFQTSTNSLISNSLLSNYDPSKLTTVILTGVTALVRATAVTMEYKGVTYPGEKIRDVLREADIAHISNEIPFFTGCEFPKPDATGPLVFCSDPKYIDLLTDVGADVVELTGNHFADRGAQGMLETIEIYNHHDLPYFGGGTNLTDSLEPALFEVNGNKIAFIGCNKPDVDRFPTARDFRPGAAPCDFKYLAQKIAELKTQGYVVISTFQWNESYDSRPSPQQMTDFRLMADSGASIVSGSQAHYPQMMEFHGDAFIHYGLGNLFFDQMGDQSWMPPGIRREFYDRYAIYDGKLISVELLTGILEDYSRPRLMTDDERYGFLQDYFFYSGWLNLVPTPTPTITPTLTPMSIPTIVVTPTP
ncbi:MAG TPA: CapA family protein [Anaerolineales bacterium]|nr:CapA family protein [Anaerolineales bacterium]HNQ94361.1 CapA family protein [Anaerolineales bacterium]HNS59923.1 CapA family protein [Anaerolineales bacterium]